MSLHPIPTTADPWVAGAIYFIVLGTLFFALRTARTKQEYLLRLCFFFFAYSLLEGIAKRLTHFTPYVYPLKIALLFYLLLTWLRFRRFLPDAKRPVPFSRALTLYLILVSAQVFNPYLGNPLVGFFGWLNDFVYVLFFFLAFGLMSDREDVRRFLRLTAWLGVVTAAGAILEQAIGPNRFYEWNFGPMLPSMYADAVGRPLFRPTSLAISFGASAFVEMVAIAMMLSLLSSPRHEEAKPWLVAGILLCAVAMVLHGVRVILFMTLLITASFTVVNLKRNFLLGFLLGFLAVVAVSIGLFATEGNIGNRLATMATPVITYEGSGRLGGMLALPTVVMTYPFGIGPGWNSPGLRLIGDDMPDIYSTDLSFHNYVTDLTLQVSVLGPLILVPFCFGLLGRGLQHLRRPLDVERRSMLTGLLAFLIAVIASLFVGGGIVAYPTAPYFWFSAGLFARLGWGATTAGGYKARVIGHAPRDTTALRRIPRRGLA